ncbi:MAG: hypothetical protein SNJ29_15255 [Rikenellaceae bacterium]
METQKIITVMKLRNSDMIQEVDNNPDRWYELYTYSEEHGSQTVESADTFEEIVQHIDKNNTFNIDIWEDRAHPKGIDTLTATIPISYNFLSRIVMWFNNFTEDEGLSRELFCKVYGSVMGEHYFIKWNSVYERNILKMVGYFGLNCTDGELFMAMIESQMANYEKRIKRNG